MHHEKRASEGIPSISNSPKKSVNYAMFGDLKLEDLENEESRVNEESNKTPPSRPRHKLESLPAAVV